MSNKTIADVARAAGVAPSTVSRALQDHPRISPERRNEIKTIAARMGYRPSQVARSLVTGRTRTLGVIVTDVADPFVAQVMSGAEAASRELGYSLLFAMSHGDPDLEIDALHLLLDRQVDGLILISGRAPMLYDEVRSDAPGDWPLVLVNNNEPGNDIYSVCMDNEGGANIAVSYLQSLGHQRIAFIGGPRRGRSSRERLSGYARAMTEARQEMLILEGEGRAEDGAQALQLIVAMEPALTAVFCYNDLTALGFLSAAARLEIPIPAHLSVVGFDDIPLSAYAVPGLTTVRQPTAELGKEAVRISAEYLSSGNAEGRLLKGDLVIRGSTAAPRLPESVELPMRNSIGKNTPKGEWLK
jgi:DNA-binding LacI/PurR family transcriptional regulator